MKKTWMTLSTAGFVALASSVLAQSTPSATDKASDSSSVQTTETKQTGSGTDTKTKSMKLVGSVKSIDAGKSIVVTGPKDKDYSFNLDEKNMISKVDPAVAVGDKVRVVRKTDADGMKTLTITPYSGKHHHHRNQGTASPSSSSGSN